MNIPVLLTALKSISVYRDVCRLPVFKEVENFLTALAGEDWDLAVESYSELYYLLSSEGYSCVGEWLDSRLRYSESPYPHLVERDGSDQALESAARRDVEIFSALAGLSGEQLLSLLGDLVPPEHRRALSGLPVLKGNVPFDFESLTASYRENGTGLFAQYRAFIWERGSLLPIRDPDVPGEGDLIGYDRQRAAVVDNTRALLRGCSVNNVLLYGDSGTGKSATVKSLLSIPDFQELRIVELQKENLKDMSQLIRLLRPHRQKFILFIDDLSFDKDDQTYSLLKTILEGGLEKHPSNMAIYATSNRRQLMRQTFSDRQGDEVDASETVQEKTALSDRFGLRVSFLSLNKEEFLELVDALAAREGIDLPREELHKMAVQWELRHPGRTPRAARQFLASLV